MEFFRYFLVLLGPGLIGALAFSIAARSRTEVNIFVALILNLLTFTTMITGLYFFKDVYKMKDLLYEFTCLNFTRNYILLSTSINIGYGIFFGIIRRFSFWLKP